MQPETYDRLAWLRANEPVSRLGDRVHFVVSRAGALEVLSDPRRFSGNHGEEPRSGRVTLFEEDAARHVVRRRILVRAISAQRSARLERFAEEHAALLVRSCLDRDEPDGVLDVAEPMTSAMVGELLGVEPAQQRELFTTVAALRRERLARRDPSTPTRELPESTLFRQWVLDHVRCCSPERSALARLSWRDPMTGYELSEDELVMDAQQLCQSSTGATRLLIGNVVLQLASNASRFEQVRRNESLIVPLIEDSLRFDTPVQLVKRTCRSSTTVAGTALADGDEVIVSLTSANRDMIDPQGAPSAPHRGRVPHLAFGWGPHRCPGATLARVAARAVVRAIVTNAATLGIPDNFEYQGQPFLDALRFHGPRSLPLLLETADAERPHS